MQVSDNELKDFLLSGGLVSRTDLERAARASEEKEQPLATVLVATGVLGADEARRALSHILGIPFVRLSIEEIDNEALVFLPESFSRAHNAVAFRVQGDALEIAVLDSADIAAVQAQHDTHHKLLLRLTDAESMKRALVQYQKHLKETFGVAIGTEAANLRAQDEKNVQDPLQLARSAPAIRLVEVLLRHALNQHATDVHLEQYEGSLRVRYRTAGKLFDAMTLPLSAYATVALRLKLLARIPFAQGVSQTGRFKIAVEEGAVLEQVSVLVSVMPVVKQGQPAEKIVLHLAQEHTGRLGFSLGTLGLHGENMEQVQRALDARAGVILICGGPGDGKTTLAYTLLDLLTKPTKHIVTVEEEVHSSLPAVSQTELNAEAGMTAASSVRAALRNDADVVLVDAPLDAETAALALGAAHRGTLVLLVVEASSAAEGIEQLYSLGVDPALLEAAGVLSIYTQRVQKLCEHSKKEYRLSRAEQTVLEAHANIGTVLAALKEQHIVDAHTAWKDVPLYTPVPCGECEDGYAGVVGIQEVCGAAAPQRGMPTRTEDALYKAVQGLVGVEDLLDIAAHEAEGEI
ncbi:MAG: ATPase, T2SS/T4P/T4SS family [Candidatus Adlerbacteria bacterium]|nr:ATPase, T2SS/T4P/T4SS family [Candidatus Adlerbacteria bacterium]